MSIQMLKKWIRPIIVIILLLFVTPVSVTPVYASSIGITTEFDDLSGDSKYLGSDYRNNYRLDIEKLGITEAGDKILHSIADSIFKATHFVGFVTTSIFYYAMDFDMASLLENQINSIQEALRNSIFVPLLQLAIVGALIIAVGRYARRDFMGLMEQFGKVVFIIVLSVLVVKDSSSILTYATNITKSVSVSILTGVSGKSINNNIKDYAAEAAGVLWVSMVHEPWKTLEFGSYSYEDSDVEFFLSTASTEEREERAETSMNGEEGSFSKARAGERIAQGIIILITILIKCIVYILVAVMQVVFQVIAIVFVLMAPIILILALLPGYDFKILSIWARKIFETQLGILLLTFVMGTMILMDSVLQELAKSMGWYIVLIFQVAIGVSLYFYRDKLLHLFGEVQQGIHNPRRLQTQLKYMGNPYKQMEKMQNNHTRQRAISMARSRREPKFAPTKSNEQVSVVAETRPLTAAHESEVLDQKATIKVPQREHREFSQTNVKAEQRSVEKAAWRLHDVQEAVRKDSPRDFDTGIKSESYHAGYDVSDNWRQTWDEAERPKTSDKSKIDNKRPTLSRAVGDSNRRNHNRKGIIELNARRTAMSRTRNTWGDGTRPQIPRESADAEEKTIDVGTGAATFTTNAGIRRNVRMVKAGTSAKISEGAEAVKRLSGNKMKHLPENRSKLVQEEIRRPSTNQQVSAAASNEAIVSHHSEPAPVTSSVMAEDIAHVLHEKPFKSNSRAVVEQDKPRIPESPNNGITAPQTIQRDPTKEKNYSEEEIKQRKIYDKPVAASNFSKQAKINSTEGSAEYRSNRPSIPKVSAAQSEALHIRSRLKNQREERENVLRKVDALPKTHTRQGNLELNQDDKNEIKDAKEKRSLPK